MPGPEVLDWPQAVEKQVLGWRESMLARMAFPPPWGESAPVARGNGLDVFDPWNRRRIDLTAGGGAMALGWHNDKVLEALRVELLNGTHYSTYGQTMYGTVVDYAVELTDRFPEIDGVPQKVWFAGNEHEALEVALAAISRRRPSGEQVRLGSPWYAPEGQVDIDWTGVQLLSMELVEDGRPWDTGWVQATVASAREAGVPVLANETITGFGRTGHFLAQEEYLIQADLTVLGNAGGGGLPFGAVVGHGSWFDGIDHRSVFAGNPLVCAAGLMTLRQINAPLLDHVNDAGWLWRDEAEKLTNQFPGVVEGSYGMGLARGLVMDTEESADRLCRDLYGRGVIVRPYRRHPRVLRIEPPLVVSEDGLRWVADLFTDVLLDWEDARKR